MRRLSPKDWPFGDYFSPADIAVLPDEEIFRIIGYVASVLERHRRSMRRDAEVIQFPKRSGERG
jgi:glutathione S-transferase